MLQWITSYCSEYRLIMLACLWEVAKRLGTWDGQLDGGVVGGAR